MRASLRGPRPEDTSAIGRHWRRWLSSASSTAVESPAIESWWGRPGSPSMTKRWLLTSLPRLPIRSHLIGQTHTHRSSRFLSPLRLSPFPSFSSSFARFEACIRAGTCGDRAASREFNNCRSSRSRVNTVPRARSFYERLDISRIYTYVYVCTRADKGSSVSRVKRAIAHSPLIGIPKITMPCRDHLLRSCEIPS